jgi:hypothetical protein
VFESLLIVHGTAIAAALGEVAWASLLFVRRSLRLKLRSQNGSSQKKAGSGSTSANYISQVEA